jgi:hypothetical protein
VSPGNNSASVTTNVIPSASHQYATVTAPLLTRGTAHFTPDGPRVDPSPMPPPDSSNPRFSAMLSMLCVVLSVTSSTGCAEEQLS